MGVGSRAVTREGLELAYSEAVGAAAETLDSFAGFFNGEQSIGVALENGRRDFYINILPSLIRHSPPDFETAVELGAGAGRLVAACCPLFKKVVGLDIHSYGHLSDKIVKAAGHDNAEFKQVDYSGRTWPLAYRSVSFCYSIYVFTYVDSIATITNHLTSLYQVLKPNGVALVFVGATPTYANDTLSRARLLVDRFASNFPFVSDHKQPDQCVANFRSLSMSYRSLKRISKQAGFDVLDMVRSKRLEPPLNYAGQWGVVLKKQKAGINVVQFNQ